MTGLPALAPIGFSLLALPLLLLVGLWLHRSVALGACARVSQVVLLAGLTVLQGMHAHALGGNLGWIDSPVYVGLLWLVAPAFYLFLRGALTPRTPDTLAGWWPYLPALLAPWLAPDWMRPLAFAYGAALAGLLIWLVWRLRAQRRRFRLELAWFAAFALLALATLGLGLLQPWFGPRIYVIGYSSLVAAALWWVLLTLLRFPDLVPDTREVVRSAYAKSTLGGVDCEQAVVRLERLMREDRLYADEGLSLAGLAAAMELSPHQMSELLNVRMGQGFSRYLRGQRVDAARRMLRDEPRASVLSVGLAVGFSSQSNFYAAFRELTGEVPGRYRRRLAGAAEAGPETPDMPE